LLDRLGVGHFCGNAARQIRKFSDQNPEVLHPKSTHGLPNHDFPNASSIAVAVWKSSKI